MASFVFWKSQKVDIILSSYGRGATLTAHCAS
jgi:hypothetical protein